MTAQAALAQHRAQKVSSVEKRAMQTKTQAVSAGGGRLNVRGCRARVSAVTHLTSTAAIDYEADETEGQESRRAAMR